MIDRTASGWICRAFAVLMLVPLPSRASDGFWISAGAQMWSGKYVYQTTTTTFALDLGMRYQHDRFSVSALFPLLLQNSGLVHQSAGMMLPGIGSATESGNHHGGMMGGSGFSPVHSVSAGDLLFWGTTLLFHETDQVPWLSLTGQIKVPTAGATYGTGEWDYGGWMSAGKSFGPVGVSVDAGYLLLGDPPGVTYQDPVTIGAGVSWLVLERKLSTTLYFYSSSKVFDTYDPPRQLSLGAIYYVSPSTALSAIASFGMSNTVPGTGVSLTVDQRL